jgi:hypothetical protein
MLHCITRACLFCVCWQIDRHYRATQRQQRRRREYLHDHAHFFANKWARVNKRDAQPAASAGSKLAHPAAAAAAAAQAAAKASEACQVLGPLGGPRAACVTRYNLLARSSNAASLTADSAAFAADAGGGSSSRPPWWCCSRTAWAVSQGSFPAAQRLSNMLLVVLQYWGLGPGVLLCTFMLLQDIRVNVLGQVRGAWRARLGRRTCLQVLASRQPLRAAMQSAAAKLSLHVRQCSESTAVDIWGCCGADVTARRLH